MEYMGLVECFSHWNAQKRQHPSKLLQGNSKIIWLVIEICHITTLKLPLSPIQIYSLKEISFVLVSEMQMHRFLFSSTNFHQ